MPSNRPPPIIQHQARVPHIGKGGHNIRGTATQRREMYEQFRAYTKEVLDRLLEILRDEEADHGHVIQAGKEILNRGWGAVPQTQVIEAVFQHQHNLNMDALREMSSDDLARLENTLARLVTVDEAQIIEGTAAPVEVSTDADEADRS